MEMSQRLSNFTKVALPPRNKIGETIFILQEDFNRLYVMWGIILLLMDDDVCVGD